MNKPDETQKPTVPDHVGIKPDGTPYDKRSNAEIVGEALGWDETQRHEPLSDEWIREYRASTKGRFKTPHQPAGPELKPCPFCGNVPELMPVEDNDVLFRARCGTLGCPLDMNMVRPEVWNTRADLTHADAIKVIEAKRDEYNEKFFGEAVAVCTELIALLKES